MSFPIIFNTEDGRIITLDGNSSNRAVNETTIRASYGKKVAVNVDQGRTDALLINVTLTDFQNPPTGHLYYTFQVPGILLPVTIKSWDDNFMPMWLV